MHTPDDLDDLYQLRALLEGFAARRAAARIGEEDVARLRESCDRFDALSPEDELRELVRENLLFHNTILDAAGSARLASMVHRVIQLPLVYKSYIWYSPDQKRISAHYHRQLERARGRRRRAGGADHEGARLRGARLPRRTAAGQQGGAADEADE